MIAAAERTRDRWQAMSPGAEIDVSHEMTCQSKNEVSANQ